jgi:Fur family transcriptional regulator, stress-responsive regulator
MRSQDEERLRAAGLRVTRPRLAVLAVLDEARDRADHLAVTKIVAATRARLGDVSTQAVYDCLEALSRAGLARRVETAGSPARYESRVGDNHHHLVCRGCGHTVDVDCAVGPTPCLQPSVTPAGFTVDEAEVVFWGLCPDCTARSTSTHDRTAASTNEEGRG